MDQSKITKDYSILSASIIGGLFLGLIIDKLKALKKVMGDKSSSPIKRRNTIRKYSQRKQSGIPIFYNRIQRSKKKNESYNNTLVQELAFLDTPTCEICKVNHLAWDNDKFDFPDIVSPLMANEGCHACVPGQNFLREESFVSMNSFVLSVAFFGPSHSFDRAIRWLRAGPRKYLYFEPEKVKAAIITCGGICPGINVVIREITMALYYNYKVKNIYGIQFGFRGINKYDWMELTPENVKTIHNLGGSILGVSHIVDPNIDEIVNTLESKEINQFYLIGGRETIKIGYRIYREIKNRKLNIAIGIIPKTIGNDLPIFDACFGFQTVVEAAQSAIKSAYVESHCAEYGLGLVKLLGKFSGFIAMEASFASRDVNICLVPEFGYELNGKNGFLQYVFQRLLLKKHCVIVVAEGAEDSLLDDHLTPGTDFGAFLRDKITLFLKSKGMDVTLKYIDPTYMIRSIEPVSYDKKICTRLAQNAVHCMMAGFTGGAYGLVNKSIVVLPMEEMLSDKYANQIVPNDRNWQKLLAMTGQPSFINDEFKYVRMEKQVK